MASGNTFMITEEAPVTEKTLDAPIVKSYPTLGPNTIFVKAVKHDVNNNAHDNR